MGRPGHIVQAILGTAVIVAHGIIQGAIDVAAELLAEIIEIVSLTAPRRRIGGGIAVDAQEDLRLKGGSLCHTGLQYHLGTATGIDEQYRSAPVPQNSRQFCGDLPIHIVLMLPRIESQSTHIGAAVARVNDDSGPRYAAGRIIELQRKGVAIIAGGIAAHAIGLAEPQRQGIAAPGSGREDRVLGQAGEISAGRFEIIEGKGDSSVGIAHRIAGGLAHIQCHRCGAGIGGNAHAIHHHILHLLAAGGNIPRIYPQAAGQLVIAIGGTAAGKDDHIAYCVIQRTLRQRVVAAVAQVIQRAGGEGFRLACCYHNGAAAAYFGDLIDLDGGARLVFIDSFPAALKGDIPQVLHTAAGRGGAISPSILHIEGILIGVIVLAIIAGQCHRLAVYYRRDLGILISHGRQGDIGITIYGQGTGRYHALEDLHIAGDLIHQRFILMYDGKGI